MIPQVLQGVAGQIEPELAKNFSRERLRRQDEVGCRDGVMARSRLHYRAVALARELHFAFSHFQSSGVRRCSQRELRAQHSCLGLRGH